MESYTKFTYRCRIREKWFCTMNSVIPDYIVLFLAKPFGRSCEGIPGIQSSSQITPRFNIIDWKCCIAFPFSMENILIFAAPNALVPFAKGICFLAGCFLFLVTLVTFWKWFSIYSMRRMEFCFLWTISTHFWGVKILLFLTGSFLLLKLSLTWQPCWCNLGHLIILA